MADQGHFGTLGACGVIHQAPGGMSAAVRGEIAAIGCGVCAGGDAQRFQGAIKCISPLIIAHFIAMLVAPNGPFGAAVYSGGNIGHDFWTDSHGAVFTGCGFCAGNKIVAVDMIVGTIQIAKLAGAVAQIAVAVNVLGIRHLADCLLQGLQLFCGKAYLCFAAVACAEKIFGQIGIVFCNTAGNGVLVHQACDIFHELTCALSVGAIVQRFLQIINADVGERHIVQIRKVSVGADISV